MNLPERRPFPDVLQNDSKMTARGSTVSDDCDNMYTLLLLDPLQNLCGSRVFLPWTVVLN